MLIHTYLFIYLTYYLFTYSFIYLFLYFILVYFMFCSFITEALGYKTKCKRKSKPRKLAPSLSREYEMPLLPQHQPAVFHPSEASMAGPFSTYRPAIDHYGYPVSPESFPAAYQRFLQPRHICSSFENNPIYPTKLPLVASLAPMFDNSESGRLEELQVSPSLCDQPFSNGNAIGDNFLATSRLHDTTERPLHFGSERRPFVLRQQPIYTTSTITTYTPQVISLHVHQE